jgi:glycosyltransferase involved in cell wall biosynthesis
MSRASRRRKLLFVADLFPYPLDRGQHVRVQNLLAACGQACEVTFVGPAPAPGVDRREVEQHCTRVVYLTAPNAPWRKRLSDLARTARLAPGVPWPATLRRNEAFVAALSEVRPETFDLVWAERPHIARLCADFRSRTIIDLDDIEHVKVARRFRVQRNAAERAHSAYRYMLFRHLELSWSRQFLASVVCSENDRAYLVRHGCRNAIVVPNGPGSRSMVLPARRPRDPASPLRIAFLGNVDSVPNADAIAWFADDILPALRAHFPEAILDVIGPGATPAIRERYASRAHFRGFVDDLGAALAEYDLLVAPLRFGGGTKLKVLDAMAHGVPVVTSSVGAEGLSLTNGEHVLLADTVDETVEGILSIKRDPDLADRLVTNAFTVVSDLFSWETIQHRLADWLRDLQPRAPSESRVGSIEDVAHRLQRRS